MTAAHRTIRSNEDLPSDRNSLGPYTIPKMEPCPNPLRPPPGSPAPSAPCRRGSTARPARIGTTSRPTADRIEQLLLPDVSHPAGRLCVLGAGNCNDLDLRRLSERFDEIHLIDLDPAALGEAVRRQGVEGCANVRLPCANRPDQRRRRPGVVARPIPRGGRGRSGRAASGGRAADGTGRPRRPVRRGPLALHPLADHRLRPRRAGPGAPAHGRPAPGSAPAAPPPDGRFALPRRLGAARQRRWPWRARRGNWQGRPPAPPRPGFQML